MPTNATIEARDLTRRVGDRTLLDSVSMTVCPGQRIGLVGPTGSGKSLFLRSLAMLEPISSGEIRWLGIVVDAARSAEFRSQVIYVHQRAGGFEGTVESILQMPFQFQVHRERRYDRAWIIEQLDRVGKTESFLDQHHEQLSGGEMQLVSLLRAVQLSPQILLLDEPTAALDRQSAADAESIVVNWYQQLPDTRSFVWVSHDPDQAERVSDSIICMNAGRLDTNGAQQ